ncbi:hypothetical protein BSKO_04258 [Bryopsis sp. KO-2023]|nr:hypothetical protein BSKO_04258 [Bryopsis sp. KO-2023]
MARTRTTPRRGGAGARSASNSANASEPVVEGRRRERARGGASARKNEQVASDSDPARPGPKRKRPEAEDLGGTDEGPGNNPLDAAISGVRALSATQEPSRMRLSGGPGDKLLKEEGAEENVGPRTRQLQWGSLISQYPQHPHVSLTGENFSIGRSKDCDLSFSDRSLIGQLCSLNAEDRVGRVVMLTCHSASNMLSVNGRILKEAEKVEVKGGDEVNIMGSSPYSYIFQHLEIPPSVTPPALPPATSVQADNTLLEPQTARWSGDEPDIMQDVEAVDPGAVDAPVNAPAGSGVSHVEGEPIEVSQTDADKDAEESRENKEKKLKGVFDAGSSSCPPMEFPRFPSIKNHQADSSRKALAMEAIRNTISRVSESAKKVQQDMLSVQATITGSAMDWAPDNSKVNKQLENLCDEFREFIVLPENLDVSLKDFPYHIGEGLKERLLHTAFVHFQRPQYRSYISDLASMSSRILLTGPAGSSRCQEALVKALAKDVGARVLAFDKVQFGVDGDHVDQECDQDLGIGPLDDCDEMDFLEDIEGKTSGGSAAEAVRHALSNPAIGPPRKKFRFTMPSRPMSHTKDKTKGTKSPQKPLKKGDRVVYFGNSLSNMTPPGMRGGGGTPSGLMAGFPPMGSSHAGPPGTSSRRDQQSSSRGPWVGCAGRVATTFRDNSKRVGVRFDDPVPGGTNLGYVCEDGHGFFCNSAELRLESSNRAQEHEASVIDAMFDVATEAASKQPLIVVLKDVEKCVGESGGLLCERYLHLKRRMDRLEGPVLVIGLHTIDSRRERPQSALFNRLTPHPSTLLELGLFDNFNRWEDKGVQRPDSSKVMKILKRLLPNRFTLCAPHSEDGLSEWKKLMQRDMGLMREESNRHLISTILNRCGIDCPDLPTVVIRDTELVQEQAERLVGLGVANALKRAEKPELKEGKLVVSGDDFISAANVYLALQTEVMPSKLSPKDVATENEYERRLLSEVIPPEEVGIGFDDVGALEGVKQILQEVVMLPLQRPELFSRGQLLKPTKGVLLFGPPGTGKTMLAKAVAAESGANCINVSMSTVASKWFGEGEKYVRALFSLAHKIAPSVIFIDEVDSLLGRRDKNGEHEAMRKIKNEFMSSWDGLRTKDSDRVLVLAATNRPMDIDEAVIRRMPRRLLVDLPNAENRVKIFNVILREEEVDAGLDYDELANMTDGYSGSDIKHLCLAAAFRPVRDYIAQEKKRNQEGPNKDSIHETNANGNPDENVPKLVEEGSGRAEPSGKSDEGQDDGGEAGCGGNSTEKAVAEEIKKRYLCLKPSGAKGVKAEGGDEDCRYGADGKVESAKLRPISMEDLREAMKQVGSSVASEAMNMADLRQWNEMFGEGGSRQSTSLSYFL